MKILILSCDTGEGHNSAGRAVREAAESKGHTVEMMDMFLLSGKRTSHAVAGAYVGIVKHIPFFFGFIYKVGMLISSSRRKSPVYFANALLGKKLASYIDRHDFDIVLTPHLYPAETMTYMKKKNLLHIPAVAVGTDYTCIPFWEETNLDYYVIPHEDLIPEYVVETNQTEKEGYEAMEQLLKSDDCPTGIYCANDITAVGMLKYLGRCRNLYFTPSIIASDDIEEAQYTKPMLTTVGLPKEEMGKFALYLLLDRMKGGHSGVVRMELSGHLMIRNSCSHVSESTWSDYCI